MEALIGLFMLACLLTLVGAFLGIIAFSRVNTLTREIKALKERIADLTSAPATDAEGEVDQTEVRPPVDAEQDTPKASEDAPKVLQSTVKLDESISEPVPERSEAEKDTALLDEARKVDRLRSAPRPSAPASPSTVDSTLTFDPEPLFRALQRNWMAWLGGLCIALAGIFLAKYSIDQGLLGPGLRITLGIASGLALHVAAWWLRRKSGSHSALAAMAGGGSITLFAALLAALHFYQMFSPGLVFVLLAVVALATMWLAVSHGPLLAVIGMLGAYAVPVLVSTGSGNMAGAMIYALIITVSVLLLARVVRIGWLWWGAVVGALAWWLLSLSSGQVDGQRGLYLTVLAYLMMAVCGGNWRLLQPHSAGVWLLSRARAQGNNSESTPSAATYAWVRGLPPALLGVVLAQLISLLHSGWEAHWPAFLALPALLLIASVRQPRLLSLVWALLLGTLAGIVTQYAGSQTLSLGAYDRPVAQSASLVYSLLSLGLIFWIGALWGCWRGMSRAWWASLIAMTPVLTCLCAFLSASQVMAQTNWALLFATLAALQIVVAVITKRRLREQWIAIWHFIAGHAAYALAVAVAFEAATLTLALAAQILSLAWLIKRFDVIAIDWLLKLVVMLVVVRLTANPWLVDYPTIAHWPLWTYGGTTLLCWLSSRQLRDYPALRRWTEVASLHLFVLTIWAEARYLLHDGQVFFADYSFSEATLYIGLAGALCLVYHLRARLSTAGLKRWYQGYAFLLLIFALLNYLGILLNLLNSEPWAFDAIGTQPVFNLLTLALGLPIVLGLLFARYFQGALKITGLAVGVFSFIFVSFQIRHLWQGTVSLQTSTSAGELYTYSVVWLLMAVTAMLLGGMRQWQNLYRGGLVMLSVVILKIFLVDLSDLDGLYRVASFMGLGLALVGISFLHQKLKPVTEIKPT